jgi:Kdo2-lipid IVA lauroyltransferase/acyltransferase
MTYFAFRAACAVVPHLPEALGYRLFGWIGDLLWLCSSDIRERVGGNLVRALGDSLPAGRLAKLSRASVRNLCWNYYELFRASAWDVKTLATRLIVQGDEHVAAAHRGGRGMILVFAHVGSLEAISQVPGLYANYRFIGLVERMKDRRTHELLRAARSRHGFEVVCVDEALGAVRRLRRNWILVVGADRDVTKSGALVPFFGRQARFPSGAVRLALRFDVPVMFIYSWREISPHGTAVFHLRVHAPFCFQKTGHLDADTRAGVALVARELEPIVRARPDQWLTNYEFWPAA